jgi:predicted dehydrogenase
MFVKRLLIVGLGSIGRRHLSNIQKMYPLMKIAILRSGNVGKEEDSDLGVEVCTSSLDKIILFSPQAAIVANPASKHLNIAVKLAKQGIHIFIEKPISESSTGVSKLINICLKNKLVLMVGYNLRFLPSLSKFKNLINNDHTGTIFSIHAEVGQYLPEWRKSVDYKKTVSASKELGGGVLLELSHEIDYLNWIFGPIKWVKSHVAKLSNLEIDVEDSAFAILGLEDALGRESAALLSMDFFRHDPVRKCTVIGELGTLQWDGIMGEVKFFSKVTKSWQLLFSSEVESELSYLKEIQHYFYSIDNDCQPDITGEDGLKALICIEAIHQSNNERGTVYL